MQKLCLAIMAISLAISLGSCTKDRDFTLSINPNDTLPGPGGKDSIVAGTIKINEFLARGSTFYNELILSGNPNGGSDWIELYNTTNDTIEFVEGKWFITDSLADSTKYKLPSLTLLPKSFLVVWCDDMDTVITQIHSNFSLSKDGEDIGLYYQTDSTLLKVDGYTYGSQLSGISEGRKPDGSANWTTFSTPTPGASNN
jgi:hypothetical protein